MSFLKNIPAEAASRTSAVAAAPFAAGPLARMRSIPTGNSAKSAPSLSRKLGM